MQARVMYFMLSIPLLSDLSTVGNEKVLHNIVITESINRAVDCTEVALRFSYFLHFKIFLRHHSSVMKSLVENMKTKIICRF